MTTRYINKPVEIPNWCRRNIVQLLNHVFLSDIVVANYFPLLEQLQIKFVLSLLSKQEEEEEEEVHDDLLVCQTIRISDSSKECIYNHFPASYSFIRDATLQNKNVLIHCVAGMSRSVTIAAAYMMQRYGIDHTAAFRYILERRPTAEPNVGFVKQLKDWDKHRQRRRRRRKTRLD